MKSTFLKLAITGVIAFGFTSTFGMAQDPRLGRMQSGLPAGTGQIQSGGRTNLPASQTNSAGGYTPAPSYSPAGAGAGSSRTTASSSIGIPISLTQSQLVGARFGEPGKLTEMARIAAYDLNQVVAKAVSGSTVTVRALKVEAVDPANGVEVRLFCDSPDCTNSRFWATPMLVTMWLESNTGFTVDRQEIGGQAVVRGWIWPRDNGLMGRADKDPSVWAIYPGDPAVKIMMPRGDARFQLYLPHSTEEQMLILTPGSLAQWSSEKQGTLSEMKRQ